MFGGIEQEGASLRTRRRARHRTECRAGPKRKASFRRADGVATRAWAWCVLFSRIRLGGRGGWPGARGTTSLTEAAGQERRSLSGCPAVSLVREALDRCDRGLLNRRHVGQRSRRHLGSEARCTKSHPFYCWLAPWAGEKTGWGGGEGGRRGKQVAEKSAERSSKTGTCSGR